MWKLTKTIEIDAAHCLPTHAGACARMHGHRWKVTVGITANELNQDGMVVDFGVLKDVVQQYDHRVLNECKPFGELPPTAENIAREISLAVRRYLPVITSNVEVTVEETPGSRVTYIS